MADNHSDRDQLLQLIRKNDEYAIAALLKIYSYQTGNEQNAKSTVKKNSMGFNAVDAGFMSGMAEQYLKKGSLTERQIPYVKKIMPKYIEQLLQAGITPTNISKPPPIEKKGEIIVKVALQQNNDIVVKFSYPKGDKRFFEMITNIKALPGRRFIKTEACWKCPLSIEAVKKLIEWEFDISANLLEWYKKITTKTEVNCNIEIPGLQKELYPFQKEGVSFIDNRGGRALVGDEMGLGKTAMALAWLQLRPELKKNIVICPSSLLLNWAKEVKMWMGEETIIANGNLTERKIKYNFFKNSNIRILIISYDILVRDKEYINAL